MFVERVLGKQFVPAGIILKRRSLNLSDGLWG
jgi:hypothetical protein